MPAMTGGTPESILPRTDSKNPATTCKGLTSTGRPCRRSLASPKDGNQGVFAVLPHTDEGNGAPAAYFCWQHKEQAANLVQDSGQILNLQSRSSIDTLMEKIGVLDIKNSKKASNKKRQAKNSLPQGPLLSVAEDPFGPPVSAQTTAPKPRPVRRRKDQVHITLLCCMRHPQDEQPIAARPRPATVPSVVPQTASIPYQSSLQAMPITPLERHTSLPGTISPIIRSNLIAELSRPLTIPDHEPGYIYIFWLTPQDVPQEAAREASSLLMPPDQNTAPRHTRRTSDVLREYNYDASTQLSSEPRKIMLKIGRASNVHRRMIQWSQQCGQHITLLRYYPYQQHNNRSSMSLSPKASPRASSRTTPTAGKLSPREPSPSPTQKVPFVPRVERLIHLELAEKQIKSDCEGCGKTHREWFEVEATREGIREVDAVIRRWITWAQQRGV